MQWGLLQRGLQPDNDMPSQQFLQFFALAMRDAQREDKMRFKRDAEAKVNKGMRR